MHNPEVKNAESPPSVNTTSRPTAFLGSFSDGMIIIGPNIKVVFESISNTSKLVLRAYSSVEIIDVNGAFRNDSDIEVALVGNKFVPRDESI